MPKLILAILFAAAGQAAFAAPEPETPVVGNRLEITQDGRLTRAWLDPGAAGEAVRIEADFPAGALDIPVRCGTVSPQALRAAAQEQSVGGGRSAIPAVEDLARVTWLAEQRLGAEAKNVLWCEAERRLPVTPTAGEHASSNGMLSTVAVKGDGIDSTFRALTVVYPQRLVVVAFPPAP